MVYQKSRLPSAAARASFSNMRYCTTQDRTLHLPPVPASIPRRSGAPSAPRQRAARGESRPSDAASNGRKDNVSIVYDELRGLIVWGQLPPGARIAERAVAERLGLSRTPVRSGLPRLQQEGFVAAVGRGAGQGLVAAPLAG